MASVDVRAEDPRLRRVRSLGDIPTPPPPPSHARPSLRTLESAHNYDPHISLNTPDRSNVPSSFQMLQINPDMIAGPGGSSSTPTTQVSSGSATTAPPTPQSQQPQRTYGSRYHRTLAFFGLGRGASRARKVLFSFVWNIVWGFCQVVVISTLLGLSGTFFKSPSQPGLTEWRACDRPLGIWCSLWVVRAALASGLAYWEFVRERTLQPSNAEIESGDITQGLPQTPPLPRTAQASGLPVTRDNGEAPEPPPLPFSRMYSRLTLLSSLLTLSWFLTAHILVYTSVNTCRHSSPHLWWLTFAILCIMYIMVLEVIILGLIFLIVFPILFVFWNIFLICIGRHPIQNPHMIKPEIGKLPKSVVDRIPLVMYIPPPPETTAEEKRGFQVPVSYPPKPPTTPSVHSRKHFRFLTNIRSFKNKKDNDVPVGSKEKNEESEPERPDTWEGNWEQGDYPLVVLEGNRAACAICLMDFEEPRRRIGTTVDGVTKLEGTVARENDLAPSSTSTVEIEQHDAAEQLRLEDAGDGAQPLRLLSCGHVFHKTCLDPWLTDVSGRCPVCQQAVTLPDQPKNTRRGQNRS